MARGKDSKTAGRAKREIQAKTPTMSDRKLRKQQEKEEKDRKAQEEKEEAKRIAEEERRAAEYAARQREAEGDDEMYEDTGDDDGEDGSMDEEEGGQGDAEADEQQGLIQEQEEEEVAATQDGDESTTLGTNRNFPHELRYAPAKYNGLGLPNWKWEQEIAHVQELLTHGGSATLTGDFFRSQVEQVQVEIGTNIPGRMTTPNAHWTGRSASGDGAERIEPASTSINITNTNHTMSKATNCGFPTRQRPSGPIRASHG